MGWYTVTKKINGHYYLYLQMTYRECGKVKTKNKYLGPAHGSAQAFGSGAPPNLPIAPPVKPVILAKRQKNPIIARYRETLKRSGKLFDEQFKLKNQIRRNPFSITLRLKRYKVRKLYLTAHDEFLEAATDYHSRKEK